MAEPLPFEKFKQLRSQGLSVDQITKFSSGITPETVSPKISIAQKILPQAISRAEMAPGQRTITGDIFERPGAAIRGGLVSAVEGDGFKKGYVEGAKTPEKIPSFQDTALKSYYNKVGTGIPQQIGGLGVSAVGMAADIATNPADVATMLVPGLPGAKSVGKAIAATKPAQAVTRFVTKERHIVPALEQRLSDTIRWGIKKAVRPSVAGKNTASQAEKYYKQGEDSVKTIIENKANLKFKDPNSGEVVNRLPQDLEETLDAIGQTKRKIYGEYNARSVSANEAGVKVDRTSIADMLDKIANNRVIQENKEEVANYAAKMAEKFRSGSYTPEEAQDAIELYNNSLKNYYKNPTYVDAHKAAIDAQIAAQLRGQLDKAITGHSGKGYSDLKRSYGALTNLEKDVARRAIVAGRNNPKGLIDFTDILSAGDLVQGILTLNPAQMAKGGAMFMAKQYIKGQNNPNKIIKRMFEQADRLVTKGSGKVRPNIPIVEGEILDDSAMNTYKYNIRQRPAGGYLTDKSKPGIPFRQKTVGLGDILSSSSMGEKYLNTITGRINSLEQALPYLKQRGMVNEVADTQRRISQLNATKNAIEEVLRLKSAKEIAAAR